MRDYERGVKFVWISAADRIGDDQAVKTKYCVPAKVVS